MKIATCLYQDQQHLALIHEDAALLPARISSHSAFTDCLSFIQDYDHALEVLAGLPDEEKSRSKIKLNELALLAPIPRPSKNIICLGWNYSEHIKETSEVTQRDSSLPEHPIVFTKNTTSVIGPDQAIPYDAQVSDQIDWEVELGVIIGKPGRGISEDQAWDHVFGYTIINDISARDLQFQHKQFFIGKSLDGACPMGPRIVTQDEIHDPHDLFIRCEVNGIRKQDSNTRHMIFDIPAIISTLSRGMTLEAGDIIATGTPDGVGFARQPAEFLKPGDIVSCEIEGIGTLKNSIAQ